MMNNNLFEMAEYFDRVMEEDKFPGERPHRGDSIWIDKIISYIEWLREERSQSKEMGQKMTLDKSELLRICNYVIKHKNSKVLTPATEHQILNDAFVIAEELLHRLKVSDIAIEENLPISRTAKGATYHG